MPTIMRRMNLITRCYDSYRADRLRDTELSSCHHSFVLAICRHPGMSQEQLARHTCLNKSTVTRTLSYLEDKGYVERHPSDADKRITLVFPTDKMQEVLPQVRQIALDWNALLTAELTEAELVQLDDILDRLTRRAATWTDKKEEVPLP